MITKKNILTKVAKRPSVEKVMTMTEAKKTQLIQITVQLDPEIHKKLKIYCAEKNLKMRVAIEQMIALLPD